jgi:mycothiol S-conjugate amidase
MAMHEKFVELGLESPFDEAWRERAAKMTRTYTTAVDISDYADIRRQALLAHATQVDPTSPFWFGLPPEVARTIHPVDEYILARSLVGPTGDGVTEDDLFAGVRDLAAR